MSLLFNMLSRLVITFLPRSKRLLLSWLQSPSAVILELKKIKSVTLFPSLCQEVMGPDAMTLVFWMLSLSQLFHFPLSIESTGFLVPLHFLFSFQSQRKAMPKNAQTTAELHYGDCSHESKRRLLLGRKVMTNLDSIKAETLFCQQRFV